MTVISKRNPNIYVKGSYVNEPESEVVALMDEREQAWDDGWDSCVTQIIDWLETEGAKALAGGQFTVDFSHREDVGRCLQEAAAILRKTMTA